MQYMLLLVGDEDAERAMPETEQKRIIEEHFALGDKLRDSGAHVFGVALQPSSTATTVDVAGVRPAEIISVAGVRPFYRALAAGAARVTTPFFIQVDADMVLDEACIERLRDAMTPEIGITVGQLR